MKAIRVIGAVLLILVGLYACLWAWAMLLGFPMQESISMIPWVGGVAIVVAILSFYGSYRLFRSLSGPRDLG